MRLVPLSLYFKGVILLLTVGSLVRCKSPVELPVGDVDRGGLFVPDGFEVKVVADSTGRARHITVSDNGDIYVKLISSDTKTGGNLALRDTTGDGRADIMVNFGGVEARRTSYGSGMTIHNGYLYFSSATIVYRMKLTPGQLVPEGEPEVVFTDDHEHGVHWHITKPVAFDKKGNMYIPFGGPSNACQDISQTPNGAPGGVGLDPCPELEHHGGVWKFDASRTGLTQKDGVRFANGLRSVVAMRWNDADDNLYIVMHGRDNLHSLFPDRFTAWQNAVLPAEEFVRVKEEDDYGWPYCYYDQMKGKKFLAPEYGGDGKVEGRCADMDLPLMGFPGHWAPNDLLFYRGDQFPERYRNGAFIAFHGSTNRAPYPQAGYFVAFIPFSDGEPTGEWEVFADGFAGVDTIVSTGDAKHRPMGLAEGPDGSLYVTDSREGKIWRIMFKGDRDNFGAGQLASMEARKNRPNIKTPDEVADDLQKNVPRDQKLYNTFCGTCHQSDGRGARGRMPPLAGSEWVTGNKQRLIYVALNGLRGPIEVNGESYNSVMPSLGYLNDDDLATILTYVRRSFGNQAGPVSPEEVKALRE